MHRKVQVRKLLFLIFVILLVAVSWFKPAFCEPLDKDALIRQYLAGKKSIPSTATDNSHYTSPAIYGDSSQIKPPLSPDDTGMAGSRGGDISGDPQAGIQKFDSTESLRPFGYDLFERPMDVASAPEVADAADYLLGPGDNIIIYLWGSVEKEFDLVVDRQGKIFIPKLGEIIVHGKSLNEFESLLNKKFSGIYSDFKLSVTLGKIRSIRIYLTGEVRRPGAYTVSSLTTLFNALYLAGGPNLRGSMRNIQLIRNNKIETSFDLYQFLLKGENNSDIRLASGDAIFVPVCGPRVTISGEIKRPAIYELKGGETVADLTTLAGGTTAQAYLDRVMLDRISTSDERQVIDLNLNPGNGQKIDNIALNDGDRLQVFSLYDMKKNIAYIDGMVKHPGEFERSDSTSLAELLNRGELLPENVFYERANLFRRYPDRRSELIPVNLNDVLAGKANFMLQDNDSLYVYSIDQMKRKKFVYIEGEVEKPGQYPLYDNMNLADLIFLAGDLKKNAYQLGFELARIDTLGNVQIQYIDIPRNRPEQIALQEDDRVFVRRIPDWFLHRMVTIDGEVRFPGQYALISRNETLYELIQRAGGFTERAFIKGTIFRRNTIEQNLERRNLPEIIANSQPLEQDSTGKVRKAEVVNFKLNNMNRIVLDLEKIIDSKGERGNVTMQNGDMVFIPEIPSGISVMGSVGSNGTIKFERGKNVKYYIEKAGNFTTQANKKETKLIKADGRVFSGGGTLGKKVEVGDAIVIPTEIKKERDWLKTMSATVSILGGIMTSIFIIDKL
ncbi:exported hypothetical protein [Candidatus Zixiibacteriota bacterium]|nr:exported hypothetical protein [candidate division Zixibacteria bacterium]